MNIGYLMNTYPMSSTTFVRREINALERAGHTVHRFAIRPYGIALVDPGDLAEAARTEHILTHGARTLIPAAIGWMVRRPLQTLRALRLALQCGARGAGGAPGTGGRLRHLIYLIEAAHVARRSTELRLTHIHAHFGTNATTVAMLSQMLDGPPYSFTVHGPEEFDAPLALSLGVKIERAAFVAAISSFGRSQLCRWTTPDHWPRLAVVHCGIEPWRFPPPSPPHSAPQHSAPLPPAALSSALQPPAAQPPTAHPPSTLPHGGPHLIAIGRLSEQKGFALLVEAMALAAPALPGLHLTLVGDGPLRPPLERQIAAATLQSRITLAGWQTEAGVRAALNAATALILPSFAEGLPVVVMEAMASGRPVIATAIAGIPELVTSDTGWLVPAGDPKALAGAIAALAATPHDRLTLMGDAARRRAIERHDIDTEAAKLAALIAGARP